MSKLKLLQLTLITGTLVVLAGCSSTPSDDSGTSGAGADSTAQEETVPAESEDEVESEPEEERQVTTDVMPMDEPMAEEEEEAEPAAEEETTEVPEVSMPEETTVYFAFDSYALDSDTRSVLNDHIAYLRENQETTVVLEGHTDERGSAEYNLALGENRAQAVQDYMNLRGISNSQMYTTSFGEMQPAVNESNEEAWAQNRRVEIQYQN